MTGPGNGSSQLGPRDLTSLSKLLSHALRHDPGQYGLALDHNGWVPLDELLAALRRIKRWQGVTLPDVEAAIASGTKRRHEIVDGRIRAVYGHSAPQPVEYEPAEPPPVLFHGTTADAAGVIAREGLRPMSRQYVHLSDTPELATTVGSRRTRTPVVLRVDAAGAHAAGTEFFDVGEGVWLCRSLDPRWIASDGLIGG